MNVIIRNRCGFKYVNKQQKKVKKKVKKKNLKDEKRKSLSFKNC